MLKSSNPYREITNNKSSEKTLTPTSDLTLTLTQDELFSATSAQSLHQPTQYCVPQLGTVALSLSNQLLPRRWTLMASRFSLWLLALNHCFSPTKYEIPSKALHCLCVALQCLSTMHPSEQENLPPTLLSLPLSHCFQLTSSLSSNSALLLKSSICQ